MVRLVDGGNIAKMVIYRNANAKRNETLRKGRRSTLHWRKAVKVMVGQKGTKVTKGDKRGV